MLHGLFKVKLQLRETRSDGFASFILISTKQIVTDTEYKLDVI